MGYKYKRKLRASRRDYVYLIRVAHAIKIGISHFPLQRFDRISENEPDQPVQLLACVSVVNAPLVEALLHKQYATARIHGEWFALSEDHILDLLETFYTMAKAGKFDRSMMPQNGPTQQEQQDFLR